MMNVSLIEIDGEDVVLLVAPPAYPVRMRYRRSTRIELGETGIEHRTPEHEMRLSISYSRLQYDSDWQTWRDLMGQLGGKRVAVPIWPDVRAAEDWADRIHHGALVVGWDEGYTNITPGTAEELPETDYLAPLMVGLLTQPRRAAGFTPVIGVPVITVEEDRPWDWRVTAAQTDPELFEWSPDWVGDLSEESQNFLRTEQLGRGPELRVEGDEASRIVQGARFTLKADAFGEFLAFWDARKASYEAFDFSSLFQPGVETPSAPHIFDGEDGHGLMRFATDELEVEWATPAVCRFETSFQQVILTEDEQEQPETYYLYRFYNPSDPDVIELVTEAPMPIDYDEETWEPAKIQHDKIRRSIRAQDERVTITLDGDSLQVGRHFMRRHEIWQPIWVEILEADVTEEPVTATSLFVGKIQSARSQGQRVTVEAQAFGGMLARQHPRYDRTRNCPYSVYGAACGVSKASFEGTGDYDSFFDDDGQVEVIDNLSLPSGAPSDSSGWWDGGWAETGSGWDKQMQPILNSAHYPDSGELHLRLLYPFIGVEADQEVRFYPGCDGSYGTCKTKFGNGTRYGGAPFIPAYIKEVSTSQKFGGK